MGISCAKCGPQKNILKKELIVGTLNYCSIMVSPFEFYSQSYSKQLQEISNIFDSLIPQYVQNFNKDTFKWSMGKIDVKMRSGRYSPLFSHTVGIENNHFITRQRFNQLWDQIVSDLAPAHNNQFTSQQLQTAKLFDFIAYHALLAYVYKYNNFDKLIKENTAQYINIFKPFFQQSFLDQKKKLDKVIANFKDMKIDVFFLQEYSQLFQKYIDSIEQFIKITGKTKDTMIIARKTSFTSIQKTENVLSKEQRQSINWAGKTSILCLDNLILINVHLHSKVQKNKKQIKELKTSLVKLKKQLPTYDIILGGDINSFLPPSEQLNEHFTMFPTQQNQITTSKKRTMAQAQYHKGNVMVQQSKDKIITNLKLKNCKIVHIDSEQPKAGYMVPSDDHPFDHYLVIATIYK